jgi:hypothetical protein
MHHHLPQGSGQVSALLWLVSCCAAGLAAGSSTRVTAPLCACPCLQAVARQDT